MPLDQFASAADEALEALLRLGTADWIAVVAGLTIVTASFIAAFQDNLKRRLAYSTISYAPLYVDKVAAVIGHAGRAAILHAQLHQPLSRLFHPMLGERTADVLALAGADIQTLDDLLHAATPSMQLLQLAKDYAKSAPRHPHDAVPRDVAKVLYFAAISVAQRHGHRISSLTPTDVREGIAWACRLPWVDSRTKAALKPKSV